MRNYFLLIGVLIFSVFFMFGCRGVNSDCGDLAPELRNGCCAEKNADTPHIECVGEWLWNTNTEECYFACQTEGEVVNPASNYCKDNGYTWEIIKDAQGNEYGICKFPDGSQCEEWDYFNGKCKPGDTTVAVPTSKEQCESLGGKWGKFGLAPVERCNLPTTDGKSSCTDGSQCQAGLCIAESEGASLGKCPEWKMNFGCMSIIENGKFIGICID